ncbi:MAG: hypothetical protein ACYS8Z_09990 [Planctomycetota bacterium]
MPFLIGRWEYAYGWDNEAQMLAEFVRPEQTVENWTEMVTVETYNKAFDLGSVEELIVRFRNGLDELCPGSSVEVIRQTPDGVIYESVNVISEQCNGEHELVRIFDGIYNRFLVHYAVRGAATMTPERRAEWLEELMACGIHVSGTSPQ